MSKLGEKEKRNLFPEISTPNNFSSQTARHRRYSGPGSIMTDRQEERMMVLGAHAWQLSFDSWQMPKWQTKSVTVVSSVKASYGAAKTSGPTTDYDLNQLPRKGIWDTETKLLYLLKSIKKKKFWCLSGQAYVKGEIAEIWNPSALEVLPELGTCELQFSQPSGAAGKKMVIARDHPRWEI